LKAALFDGSETAQKVEAEKKGFLGPLLGLRILNRQRNSSVYNRRNSRRFERTPGKLIALG